MVSSPVLICPVRRLAPGTISFYHGGDGASTNRAPEEIKKAENLIAGMNPHAEIAYMSAETGEGIGYACDLIEQKTSSRYDDAVEAERLKQGYEGA